jgi:hypothetical protein
MGIWLALLLRWLQLRALGRGTMVAQPLLCMTTSLQCGGGAGALVSAWRGPK